MRITSSSGPKAPGVQRDVVRLGLLIRPGSEFGLEGYVRITVGPPPLMERVAGALADARQALLAREAVR